MAPSWKCVLILQVWSDCTYKTYHEFRWHKFSHLQSSQDWKASFVHKNNRGCRSCAKLTFGVWPINHFSLTISTMLVWWQFKNIFSLSDFNFLQVYCIYMQYYTQTVCSIWMCSRNDCLWREKEAFTSGLLYKSVEWIFIRLYCCTMLLYFLVFTET